MSLLPNDDDWGCLMDMDTMFLTPDVGHQIEEVIKKYPDTGLFTAITNRVGLKEQCYGGNIDNDPNVRNWQRVAVNLQSSKRLEVRKIDHIISGHLMLVKKSTWLKVNKFPEPGKILAVDNSFSKRILDNGFDIKLMEGVFIFHYYRLHKNISDKTHLRPLGENTVHVNRKRIRHIEGM